jgi:hypothetical protein
MNDIKNMIKYWKYICQSGEQPIKNKQLNDSSLDEDFGWQKSGILKF